MSAVTADGAAGATSVAFLGGSALRNPYLDLLADALRRAGVSIVKGPSPAETGRRWPGPRPDVVHLQWESTWLSRARWDHAVRRSVALVRTLARARRDGMGVVWTVHNLDDHDRAHPRTERMFQLALARLVHALVVHHQGAVEPARRWARQPAKRVVVIPHGSYRDAYPPPLDRSEARRGLGLDPAAFLYAAIGAIRPYKRLPQLIVAFREAAPSDAALVVAGWAASEHDAADVRAAAGDDRRVVIRTEMLDDDSLVAVLSAADAFVLNTRHHFTSGSLVLAMDFGLPVVAADHPYVRHLCGDEGAEYFDPDRPGDLERALLAIRRRDNAAMANANRRRAAQLSWDEAAAILKALYLEIP